MDSTDILVVGFGAAGACAAVQAIQEAELTGEKIDVLVCDRFEGGGATSRSGGIVYFGGGTDVQKKLQIEDTPEEMYKYLLAETAGSVNEDTLWRFVRTSPGTASWLRDSLKMHLNVADDSAVLCPFKTSNAPDRYSLFYSGSETSAPFNLIAKPAPRGHKAVGQGNLVGTGNVLFEDMERAVLNEYKDKRGLRLSTFTRVTELLWDDAHTRIVGARMVDMNHAPAWARKLHSSLAWFGGLTSPVNYLDNSIATIIHKLETRFAKQSVINVRKGVIICTGGFCRNDAKVNEHIPLYRGLFPIGSTGDDGDGIFNLGMRDAGADTSFMNFASAWKFIVPAASMAKGVLLNAQGKRIINEDVYGARLAEYCMLKNDSKGFLVVDQTIYDECMAEVYDGEMLFFQKLLTMTNLLWNRVKANTMEELAKATGMTNLVDDMRRYNSHCDDKVDQEFGKAPRLLSHIEKGPFYAIKFHARGTFFPSPFFTLGGLTVNERTGQVLDVQKKPIPGLFAAGRAAAGIPSKSYVSGLSLADCIYAGRRAGMYIGGNGKIFGAEFDGESRPATPMMSKL